MLRISIGINHTRQLKEKHIVNNYCKLNYLLLIFTREGSGR